MGMVGYYGMVWSGMAFSERKVAFASHGIALHCMLESHLELRSQVHWHVLYCTIRYGDNCEKFGRARMV